MTEENIEIGKEIRKKRNQMGLNQYALAMWILLIQEKITDADKKVEIIHQKIVDIESGEITIDKDTEHILFNIFGC